MPEVVFTYVAMARWVSVAVLCGLVVREILRPELDVVRADGEDDPEGGVLVDPHAAQAEAANRGRARPAGRPSATG